MIDVYQKKLVNPNFAEKASPEHVARVMRSYEEKRQLASKATELYNELKGVLITRLGAHVFTESSSEREFKFSRGRLVHAYFDGNEPPTYFILRINYDSMGRLEADLIRDSVHEVLVYAKWSRFGGLQETMLPK